MKINIIVSNTKSRFLEVLKTIQNEYINFYFIDISEIFKAYDILKPKYIILNSDELINNAISLFIKEPQVSEKLFINYDHKTYKIINKNLFLNIDSKNHKTKNVAIFDISEKENDIIKNLEDNQIDFHLFNSSLKHKYNLGTIEYTQIPDLIKDYNGIVGYNNIYSAEAILSGCSFYNREEDLIKNLLANNPVKEQELEDIDSFIENNFYDK